MSKFILLIGLTLASLGALNAQGSCIDIAPTGCRFSCVPVMYTGAAPDTATYFWSSTCGTFTNPNQQNPGNLCLLFPGTCTVQVIVLQNGMDPDTCTAEIIVFDNPDGIMSGDTTICSGDCAPVTVLFSSGTAPFAYQVDDGENVNLYSSFSAFDTFYVCPQFTTTYTLLSITDAFGCTVSGQFNDVNINVVPGVTASITQNGAMLCANPPNQNYQWWDCGYTQLQSVSQCLTMSQDGCYCLIVAGSGTTCLDTVCGTFTLPCTLTCDIVAPDSVCLGDTIQFSYNGNASSFAQFAWLITDGNSVYPFTTDTVTYVVNNLNCISATLEVTDTTCQSSCSHIVCLYDHLLFATFYSDLQTCDSCITIPIGLSGTAPYTVYISDGTTTDTLSGIMTDQFDYEVCPPLDTTITYVLLNATDSLSTCPVILGVDTVSITRYSIPHANITQTGNVLCADSILGSYAWYDTTYSQILSDSICFNLTESGTYCLVVTNGICSDTACGAFVYDSCSLTCEIDLMANACLGDSIIFAYVGNAGSGAIFNWLIDLPGFPASPFTGNDTVILAYSQVGCYGVSLTVFDGNCITQCADSICIEGPNSEVSICCDEIRCDSCADLSIGFNGTPPWTVFIGHDSITDTIRNIRVSPYLYTVCPPADSMVTYTLLGVMDTINNCPGYISGINTATVSLHRSTPASITQVADLLCANPPGMTGYAWYSCPSGPYLDTSRCFLPTVSGCYCVDVFNEFNCADSACVNIILSAVEPTPGQPFSVWPNPSKEEVYVQSSSSLVFPCQWVLYNVLGEEIGKGNMDVTEFTLTWPGDAAPGLYTLRLTGADHQVYALQLLHQ